MATTAFSPPKHWEDWVSVVFGLWLFASPWALQYGELTVTQNAVRKRNIMTVPLRKLLFLARLSSPRPI